MPKTAAKNAVVLINGYVFSTFATMYDIKAGAGKIMVQGFGDGSQNGIPGLPTASAALDMFWDSAANSVHAALSSLPTGVLTVIPEGYSLGTPSISFPFMQGNYTPKGNVTSAITVGGLAFESYGNNVGVENGVALAHGTITNTTTGTGFYDPTGAAVTAACGATLHCWGTPLAADTYVVKVQHSTTLGSGYADLITFTANGATRTVERQVVASGTVNPYRRVIATRMGSAGNSFGFSVHFYHL